MSRVVLVTGVSRYLGGRLAARLCAEDGIDRVIGIDAVPPRPEDLELLGRTEFIRADIRNPLLGKVIAAAHVDVVVHSSALATPRGAGGRTAMKELNVIGAMQLLAACQKSETVRQVVLQSTTAVYGSSARDPAVFTEEMAAKAMPRTGHGKDAVEVEGYVRGFSRRRPDITATVLRFADFAGPNIDTPLARYLGMRAVPTPFGYDPRLQLVHEQDAIEVLRLAAVSLRPGTFNVAGEGAMTLSQAIRRAGRIPLPIPGPATHLVRRVIRRTGRFDFSSDQIQLLNFGRVVDTTRLHNEFGYVPRYTTAQAFDELTARAAGRKEATRA
jgi:UDP-glucose 4-epimerase